MVVALRPPIASVDRFIAAPVERVWEVLTDLEAWQHWGPSVRRAALSDGGGELRLGARGTVWTAVGVPLPFTITEFEPRSRWSWVVAGLPATGHAVSAAPGGCLTRFEVPWWATAYLPVCAVALRRIGGLVERRD